MAMGGTTNAYTSFDRTVYYINTGAGHWQDALDLLLSYVSENVVDPKEVAREKKVIQQEMKMGESNPNTELWKLFVQTAYQKNPVRYPVIGYEEVFVQQSREALLDYYQQRYQPENVIVAAVRECPGRRGPSVCGGKDQELSSQKLRSGSPAGRASAGKHPVGGKRSSDRQAGPGNDRISIGKCL